jgi:hypothetical protein
MQGEAKSGQGIEAPFRETCLQRMQGTVCSLEGAAASVQLTGPPLNCLSASLTTHGDLHYTPNAKEVAAVT